jgi:uncharacterized protein YegP (UPF0339 family)
MAAALWNDWPSDKRPGSGFAPARDVRLQSLRRPTHFHRGKTGGNDMPGIFDLKKAANGQFMFNLKAANHEVILTSELYHQKHSALEGIASVKTNAAQDERYDRRKAKDGSPYFVLLAANRQVIGTSEMYSSAAAMENGIRSVKQNGPTAEIHDSATA